MSYEIKQDNKFKYIEEGEGEPLVLLHGLFGALSNFQNLIEYFKQYNKVVVPILPLLDMDILHTSVGGLAKFVNKFIDRAFHDHWQVKVREVNAMIGHARLWVVVRTDLLGTFARTHL